MSQTALTPFEPLPSDPLHMLHGEMVEITRVERSLTKRANNHWWGWARGTDEDASPYEDIKVDLWPEDIKVIAAAGYDVGWSTEIFDRRELNPPVVAVVKRTEKFQTRIASAVEPETAGE